MSFSEKIKKEVMLKSKRHCAICFKSCGMNIELHHITPKSKGGCDSIENCIPLCFDHHAEVGHYNSKHPKGTKYSEEELKARRDELFKLVESNELPINIRNNTSVKINREFHDKYEDVYIMLRSFIKNIDNKTFGDHRKIYEKISVSKFIFNKEMQAYLDKLYKKIKHYLIMSRQMYDKNGYPKEVTQKLIDDHHNVLLWLENQLHEKELENKFQPFLELYNED